MRGELSIAVQAAQPASSRRPQSGTASDAARAGADENAITGPVQAARQRRDRRSRLGQPPADRNLANLVIRPERDPACRPARNVGSAGSTFVPRIGTRRVLIERPEIQLLVRDEDQISCRQVTS